MKTIVLKISMLFCLVSQLSAQQIISYNDSLFVGDTLEFVARNILRNNGTASTRTCSPIVSVNDSANQFTLTTDVLFDFRGPYFSGCVRLDTFKRLLTMLPGNYQLIYFGSLLEFNGTKDTVYKRVDSDTINFVVMALTGIEKQKLFQQSSMLIPNPTLNKFQINNKEGIILVEVYSLNGKLVKSYQKLDQYDVSDLSNGIYVVRGIGKEGEFYQKLVVAR
jgi:hypothetical protein